MAAKSNEKVSGKKAMCMVLADGKPKPFKTIAAEALPLVEPPMVGKTPLASLNAQIAVEAKKENGLFTRVANKPNTFKIAKAGKELLATATATTA
jgi:hypothetical protein